MVERIMMPVDGMSPLGAYISIREAGLQRVALRGSLQMAPVGS